MRLTTIGAALVVAGCAGTQTADTTSAAKRACGSTSCFYERDIRDFQVIDHTTLIVYVGSQRCPYQIELIGTSCDMQFAPEIFFTSLNHRASDPAVPISAESAIPPSSSPTATIDPRSAERSLSDLKICANDITIGVTGGVFTNDPANGTRRPACQIQSVASLTDDKLMELYVRKGVVAPPPPIGAGQIKVGAQTASPGGGIGATGSSVGPPQGPGPSPGSAPGPAGPGPANSAPGATPAAELDDAAR
jgi:hypothetical protein